MTTIDERVFLGAAFLDERDPDWWKADVPGAIDLDSLRLEDPAACVLGQRCPLEVLAAYTEADAPDAEDRFEAYASALSDYCTSEEIGRWAKRHGFSLEFPSGLDQWHELTLAWSVLINDRRKHAADAGEPS